jgi:cytochrome c7-like protein/cytochrome c554/c'-like protein
MNHKLKLSLFIILFVVIGVMQSWGVKGSPPQQPAGAAYKQNNCVNCHSQIVELHVGNLYLEWQLSAHQEKEVGCEKCHGGDPAISDKEKAHIGVLGQSDPKSRINWKNQPETCGACHQDVVNAFKQSAHFKRTRDVGIGPSCVNCHAHMATRVIYDSSETADLCARCHDAKNFIQPRPEIPIRAGETVMAMQRATRVIDWAQLLITHGQTMGWDLNVEQNDLKLPEEMLREAKVKWHSFNLEDIRKQADEAFLKGTKIKDGLRKKLTSD